MAQYEYLDQATLVQQLVEANAEVERLRAALRQCCRAIDNVGAVLFGTEGSKTWRDAKAPWWVELVAAYEQAEMAGGGDG